MDNLQLLKEEIYSALKDSILLDEKMQAGIRKEVAGLNDVNRAKSVLGALLHEREYIIAYLKQVIKVDTSALTVYKLRKLLQDTYVKYMQRDERAISKTDSVSAASVLKGISF